MKRIGHLWDELTSFANLTRAAQRAMRGKRNRPTVARFLFQLEPELLRLRDELRAETYEPGEYQTFEIHEPKRRLISAAPFRDRVVHHALCQILEPAFEASFVFDSYACRVGKGTHRAVERLSCFVRSYRYVLKADLQKFFPSVDHEVLKSLVARRVKDPAVLRLVNRIIDGSNPQEPILHWFPGDSLLTPSEHRRGLPIGNQTSQFLANVMLNPFDHFVKEVLRADAYVRYCDDFVIASDDKLWLHEVRDRCREFLAGLRLKLHPHKSIVSRTADGVRFLGYRVFPTHRLLLPENVTRFRRRLRQMTAQFANGEIEFAEIEPRVRSWIAHASHAETFHLREAVLSDGEFSRAPESESESGVRSSNFIF